MRQRLLRSKKQAGQTARGSHNRQQGTKGMTRSFGFIGFGICAALLAGCADRDPILEGDRAGIRQSEDAMTLDVVRAGRGFATPGSVANANWPMRGGAADHSVAPPALARSLQLVFAVNAGAKESRRYKITAEPIVADGRVFTLDARAGAMAHSTSGAQIWATDLTPPADRIGDASGGGIAYADGRVFYTTGFNELVALDAQSGQILWRQDLESYGGTPTVFDGLVYIATRDGRAWAIDAEFGRIRWEIPAVASGSHLIGGPAPAVTDKLAIFPFGSQNVRATFRKGGVTYWSSSVSGDRPGRAYTQVKDISADPVVSGNKVYLGNQGGRVVALDIETGDRLWTARNGAMSPVWPAGDSIFYVSDQNELIRADANTGVGIWSTQLPLFEKERVSRRKAIHSHYGPVLAGGRLILGSSDGVLRQFNAQNGAPIGEVAIPGGAASLPVVAGGTLYIMSGRGQLLAFR